MINSYRPFDPPLQASVLCILEYVIWKFYSWFKNVMSVSASSKKKFILFNSVYELIKTKEKVTPKVGWNTFIRNSNFFFLRALVTLLVSVSIELLLQKWKND